MKSKLKLLVVALFLILSFATSINSYSIYAQESKEGVRTIYLIRHGEYKNVDENQQDSERVLTPLGIAQARLVTNRLKSMNLEFSSLISSTMTRAKQTAVEVNKDFPDLTLEQTDLLRECTPPTWRTDVMMGVDDRDGEECAANIEAAFEKYFIPSDGKDKHDIIVCHGNVIRYLVTKVLNVDTMAWLQMGISNCSLTIIRVKANGSMKLNTFSDYGHIPENMRSFTGGDNDSKKLIVD